MKLRLLFIVLFELVGIPGTRAQLLESDQIESSKIQQSQADAIHGQHIFKDGMIRLNATRDFAKSPDNYILGHGDVIGVSAWGVSTFSQTYEVDKSGFIAPGRIPPISLNGLTFAEAEQLIERRFGAGYNFKKDEFKVSLARPRNIPIHVYGEVENPGSYNIPAHNTVFGAIMAAGGLNNIGSVREITYLRSEEQPIDIDVYEFLRNPGILHTIPLEENAVIHVPPQGKIIHLSGGVVNPGRYELKEKEILEDLFQYAGNLSADAVLNNIEVIRYEDRKEKILNASYNSSNHNKSDVSLKNGDRVFVHRISESYRNYVRITGAVSNPGEYALDEDRRLSEMLTKVKILPSALRSQAFIRRTNADKKSTSYEFFHLDSVLHEEAEPITLLPLDEIVILEQSRFADQQLFRINGAIRNPGTYDIDTTEISIAEGIYLAGGLRRDAENFAYLVRRKYANASSVEYHRIELDSALNNPTYAHRIQNGDEIRIFSSISSAEEINFSVAGAVRNPQKLPYADSLTLGDALRMAGGLKVSAAPHRIEIYSLTFGEEKKSKTTVTHISLNDNGAVANEENYVLKPYDQIYVREAAEFKMHETVEIVGEVRYKGKYPLLKEDERIADLIQRAGGLTSEAFAQGATLYRELDDTGYIAIDLLDALSESSAPTNLQMFDGDILTVPKLSNIVSIKGETRYKDLQKNTNDPSEVITVPFEQGRRADYYIDTYAGGIGEKGNANLITVVHPSGIVKSTKKYGLFRQYPEVQSGSLIIVGGLEDIDFKEILTFEPNKKAGVGLKRKVLHIGDSITNKYWSLVRTIAHFDTDAMSIDYIGTKDKAPYENEGIGGKAIDFFHREEESPFVFEGVFDFDRYLNSNNYTLDSNDWVVIQLGLNDIGRKKACSEKYEEARVIRDSMIVSMKSVQPHLRFGIATITGVSEQDHAWELIEGDGFVEVKERYLACREKWNDWLIEDYDKPEEGIYIVPLHYAIDITEDFPKDEFGYHTDNVHPTKEGLYKLGDVYYRFFKYHEQSK